MHKNVTLTLPGWLSSGAGHWQSRWEQLHGCQRVEQHDWLWPKRGDWITQLEEAVLALQVANPQAGVVLVAHSLGCHLVAAWAAISQNTACVRGALLVAPPQLERADMPPNLAAWRPAIMQTLPFSSLVVVSQNDPYSSTASSGLLATAWGAQLMLLGNFGHINADSGLSDWPAGWALTEAWRAGDKAAAN